MSLSEKSATSPLPTRVTLYLITLSSMLICALIIANLTAIQIWDLSSLIRKLFDCYLNLLPDFLRQLPASIRLANLSDWLYAHPLPVDGGIIIFPLTYVLCDLIVEVYGKRIADHVAICGVAIGLGACTCLWIVSLLPSHPNANNSSFIAISSMASRTFIASLISFWLGQRVNNFYFVALRHHSRHQNDFWYRAINSSIPAHIIDCVVFEIIAFAGRLPISEFIVQIVFAFTAGVALEALLLPITTRCAAKLRNLLQFTDGQPIIASDNIHQ